MKKIVAATDGSKSAERAIVVAASLSKAFGAQLILVTAAEPQETPALAEFEHAERATLGDLLESGCDAVLKQGRDVAARAGAAVFATERSVGDPARFILDVAREEKADAIVVGKRGRGQLAGLLIGSVSQKLVSLAPCTVIVVP